MGETGMGVGSVVLHLRKNKLYQDDEVISYGSDEPTSEILQGKPDSLGNRDIAVFDEHDVALVPLINRSSRLGNN